MLNIPPGNPGSRAAGDRSPLLPPLSDLLLWTADEAAAFLGISNAALKKLDVPTVRVSERVVKYSRDGLLRWIREQDDASRATAGASA